MRSFMKRKRPETAQLSDRRMFTDVGVVRATYLIDEEDMITRAMGKVKAADNPQEMLDALE